MSAVIYIYIYIYTVLFVCRAEVKRDLSYPSLLYLSLTPVWLTDRCSLLVVETCYPHAIVASAVDNTAQWNPRWKTTVMREHTGMDWWQITLMKELTRDHPGERTDKRSPWWKNRWKITLITELIRDHPDERQPWWETTLMRARTPWREKTLIKYHAGERPQLWKITMTKQLVRDRPDERPPWWKTPWWQTPLMKYLPDERHLEDKPP